MMIVLLLAWIVGEAWVVFVLPARDGNGTLQVVFNAFAVGTGFIASLLLRRSNRKQDEMLNFSITGRNPQQLPEDVAPSVRTYLGERAVIIASLLARGASEVFLKQHDLPPGAHVLTRQTQNTLLRRLGLWEKLERSENTLASLSDGLWTTEDWSEFITWCEQLRLLRWTMGIDTELIPLAHNPQLDFSLVHHPLQNKVLPKPDKLFRYSWDLRIERDTASEYFCGLRSLNDLAVAWAQGKNTF